MSTSTTGARLVYANAKNTLLRNKLNPATAVLTQSYLRFEANLSLNVTQYSLDVLVNDNQNPAFITQNKLALQDSFLASDCGIFVGVPTDALVTNAKVKLYSYPDVAAFTASVAADMRTFWNGNMNLTVNQRVIVPSWDLNRHYKSPIMQSGFVPAPVAAGNIQNSDDWSTDGFYPVEPNIVFVGSKKNQLQVTLPQALLSIPTNARLVVIFRGLLAQNTTPVR
jgi:hypothetical protein